MNGSDMSTNSQYEDDGWEVIVETPKLTRLDKARLKVSEVESRHEDLSKIDNPSANERRMLSVASAQLENARKKYALENKRAADDVYRRNEQVDAWRAGEGREEYNESRRKVRVKPNADLSNMTEEEKRQRVRDQKADSRWLKARRKKGLSEQQIQADFAARLEERAATRSMEAAAPAIGSTTAMEDLPNYGAF